MARILTSPEELKDRVIVEYSPEEILPKDLYIGGEGGSPHATGIKLGSAIQTTAWRDLCLNAPQVLKRKFTHGNIQVIDGKFVVTFYEATPTITNPPGD